jgi:glyoxylase-like metal-dependent hydrolase (beta-lactamase superfamily II)
MTGWRIRVVVLGACGVLGAWSGADAQPRAIYQQTQYQGQEIGRLAGDVYFARMDDYLSVFMVTPDGIVLVEPISSEFATWLKGELATRFKVPVVRHLQPPSLGPCAGASVVSRHRASSAMRHRVTRGPLAFVRPPDLTYTGPITITLGGKRVEVLPRPIAHADDNTIVRFVDGTNVLFASDWITSGRVPFGGDIATKDELALVKPVEGFDFEHFVCSHGRLGKKADVTANIKYREELRDAVAKAIAAGQTLEQAQASVTMDAYKGWEFYQQQRPGNVAGTYRALQAGR